MLRAISSPNRFGCLALIAFMLLSSFASQRDIAGEAQSAPGKHDCHIYAVDINEAKKLAKDLSPSSDPEKLKAASRKAEKTLGKFHAQFGEEIATTKSFPFPDADLTVTATVFYTDEMMDLAVSMQLGLAIGKQPVENALIAPGAAVSEVNFEENTYKVRVKQPILIRGNPWIVGLECRCMSEKERRKQLDLPPDH